MNPDERITTYEDFVAALERRPRTISPLAWLAALSQRPPEAVEWMLRWLRDEGSDS